MEKYSILVNSCDSYQDIWPYFFEILNRTWRGEKPTIFLNTESMKCDFKDTEVITLNLIPGKNKDTPWGERLLDCLSRINTDYVLMMLEDFLFEEPIKTEIISDCIESMELNHSIAAYQFIHASEGYEASQEKNICKGFSKRKTHGHFKIVAGPSLWRKKDLMLLTLKSDSPWGWEYFGNYRTYFCGKSFYGIDDPELNVFVYDIKHGGAIHRGKWVGYKMAELQKKYDIQIDYGDREVEWDWMQMPQYSEVAPVFKRIRTITSNKINTLKNLTLGLYIRKKLKSAR